MCLILFAWQAHPRYSLVIAANRDEFHHRPTASARFWEDSPDLLAGRDLQAGGTWMGISRSGRFAAVTNFREPQAPEPPLDHSRGELVTNFVTGHAQAGDFAANLLERGWAYRGFNLLLGDADSLVYLSNRADEVVTVTAGVHGLSNHLLDTSWPKVSSGRAQLEQLLSSDRVTPEHLFELLTNRTLAPGDMPQTDEEIDWPEQLMRHNFIVSPEYGTRSSTVLLVHRDGTVEFVERQYGPSGVTTRTSPFEFKIVEKEP